MGVVPDLLRVGARQNSERRSDLAESHCDGRVLSERPFAGVARVVRPAFPALVSRGNSDPHFLRRAGTGVGDVSTASYPHRLVLPFHSAASRHHRDRELLLSELSGSRTGRFAAPRPLPASIWI